MSKHILKFNEQFEDEVESPCVGVCKMGPDGYCEGCKRNREEIRDWWDFSNAEKAEIIKGLERRKRKRF